MKVQISLGTSKEDLHIAILSTDVAVIVLVVRCFAPLALRISDIELLGMEDILIEDELWMTDLPCKAQDILCFVLPNEALLVFCLQRVLCDLDFVCQLMVHYVHRCLLLRRNPSRFLIWRLEERMHLLSNCLLALKWTLVYDVCLLV